MISHVEDDSSLVTQIFASCSVSGWLAWWSMTIMGVFELRTFSARVSSCWMVLVSSSIIASAFSVSGWVLISMGKYCSRCFESRLIPWAAAISTSVCGNVFFMSCAKA